MRFAERFALPVATTFRRGHLFDALHPCYAGDLGIGPNPKLLARIKARRPGAADRRPARRNAVAELHAVRYSRAANQAGARASRAPTNWAASIIRISPSMPRRPRSARRSKACSRRTRSRGAASATTAHADYLAWTENATKAPGAVNLGEIMVWLRENLAAGRHHHQRRRQFRRLDPSLLPLPQVRQRISRRPPAPWVTACRRRWR